MNLESTWSVWLMVSTSLCNYLVPLLYPSPHSIFITTLKAGLEKAMAPPLQYSCLENSMDGEAW